MTANTIAEVRSTVREFEDKICRKAIKDITTEDVASFKTWLQDKPGNSGRIKLAHATVQKSLGIIKGFLKLAHNEAGILNEAVGQNVLTRRRKREEREPSRLAFTDEKLGVIFSSPLFTGCYSDFYRARPGKCIYRDDRFYFFLAILLTGARVGELPGSKLTDLDGVMCLDLTETGTKTKAGSRLVPILPALKKTGFIDWAQQREKNGKLFKGKPALVNWSKWSNEYLDKLDGVSDREHTIYSLRHNFRQMMRNANMNLEIVNKIFGHEGETVGDNYGRQNLTKQEAQVFLANVKEPIDLKHLYLPRK